MKLKSGKEVLLSLNWKSLYALEQKDGKAFDEYSKAVRQQEVKPNEMAAVRIVYTGYLCANTEEKALSFEEFLDELPDNHVVVMREYADLYLGKKK